MAVVFVEGGYRNVRACYMRNIGPHPIASEFGFDGETWQLFDEDGRKCVCAFERAPLFFWAAEHDIELVTLH
jgi:hypothetical protein